MILTLPTTYISLRNIDQYVSLNFQVSRVIRKPAFCIYHAKTKAQRSCAVTAQLISTVVSTTHIAKSLFFLNPKFQAYRNLLWLYSPVCVRPGRKPLRQVFITTWLKWCTVIHTIGGWPLDGGPDKLIPPI